MSLCAFVALLLANAATENEIPSVENCEINFLFVSSAAGDDESLQIVGGDLPGIGFRFYTGPR